MESLITETVALLFFVWDANEAPQRAIAILFARYVKELSIHVYCMWLAESINRWMERVAVSGGLSPLPGLIWEIVILVGHVNFTFVRKKSEFQKLLAVVMMILQLISNFLAGDTFNSLIPYLSKQNFRASDWAAKKTQHCCKQIRGFKTLQGYMLLANLKWFSLWL